MNNPEVWHFLDDLTRELGEKLPEKGTLMSEIVTIVERAKETRTKPQSNYPAGAFLHEYLIPCVHTYLATVKGSEAAAKEMLLAEGYTHHPREAFGTPASPISHPFDKILGASAANLLVKWTGTKPSSHLARACPDLALRGPHKVVFEVKYFRDGGGSPSSALASGIYQAAFYRGLPRVEVRGREWDYPFACLLAYDATKEGKLLSAWQIIPRDVRDAFWNSSNVFVAILPLPS